MFLVLLLYGPVLLLPAHGAASEHPGVEVLLVLQLHVAVLDVLRQLPDFLLPLGECPLHLLYFLEV